MCLNRRVLAGLAVAAGGIFLLVPGAFGRVLPLLFVAACPLSMVLMMRGMSGGAKRCREDAAGEKSGVSAESEIARLRAEVDQLRAAQAEATKETEGTAAADGRSQQSGVSGT